MPDPRYLVASKEITTSLNVPQESRHGSVKTPITHLIRSQALKILQRGECSFARQAIEGPEQQHIDLSRGSVEEHLLEFGTRGDRAGLGVNVFSDH